MLSATFEAICRAIPAGAVHVSEHAYDEADDDGIPTALAIQNTVAGEVIEDYPDDPRGPSCLVLAESAAGEPVHLVWGYDSSVHRAVLITVYRPDPERWFEDLRTRRPKR